MPGRVYAITGGFGVLGCAVASAVAEVGGQLALIDSAWNVPANCPGETLVLGGKDLTDPNEAIAAVDAVVDRFGALDALLNVAGGFKWETLEGGSPESWADLHRLNVVT